MNARSFTTPKADLLYRRDRDAGRCTVGQFTTAHVAVMPPNGALHIEVLTETVPPRWLVISPRMRPNEIETAIRKSATIAPVLKTTYLQMLQAGKEVR